MSAFIPFSSGSTPTNANDSYEPIGGQADGSGTTITADVTANTIGTAVELTASPSTATVSAWTAVTINIGTNTTAGANYLLSLSFDNQATYKDPIYIEAGTTTGPGGRLTIPLQVAAGSRIWAKVQSSTGGASLKIQLEGTVGTAGLGYGTMELLTTMDLSNTRINTPNIPGTGGWTTLVASTSQTYGAFIAIVGDAGSNMAPQNANILLGTGANPNEVEFFRQLVVTNSSAPRLARGFSQVINHSLASTTRIAAKALASTTTDNYRIALYGFR